MASIHTLTFSAGSTLDQTIDVTGNGQSLTAKNTRLTNGQYNLSTNIQKTIVEFVYAFQVDYNTDYDYTVTYDDTTVTIEHPVNTHFDSYIDGTHNGTTNITSSLVTTAERPNISLITNFSEANTTPCDIVECRLTFNQVMEEITVKEYDYPTQTYTQIYYIANLGSNTTVFDVNRGDKLLYIEVDNGGTLILTEPVPKKLVVDRVDVAQTSFGNSVSIYGNEDENFTFRYYAITQAAVDQDPTYVTSNVFSGLTPGSYNAHIKDSFGCEKFKAFTIANDTQGVPSSTYKYFISQKNSIRAAYRDIKDNANPFNFLYEESPHFTPYNTFTAIYGDHQLVPIQFRSTYPKHKVTIVPCDEDIAEFELSKTQITDNIERNTYLEGKVGYNADLNRLTVFFDGGNEYDRYGTILGQHSYYGTLPYHYEVGTDLRVNGQALIITSIITEANITYAVTNSQSNTTNDSISIESVHQAKSYEEYRFTINMGVMPSKFRYRIDYLLNDNTVHNTALSEVVEVIPKADLVSGKYHIVEFWNDTSDNELDYSDFTDPAVDQDTYNNSLVGFINIPFTHTMTPIINADIESAKLDNKVKKLDYSSMEVYELKIEALPIEKAKIVCKIFNES